MMILAMIWALAPAEQAAADRGRKVPWCKTSPLKRRLRSRGPQVRMNDVRLQTA